MKLYSYFRSSAAYRVRIALNCKGIKYEQEAVHLVKDGGQQHSEVYRTLNPQRLVPTLIDGKNMITQSLAILEYLEEKHPDPALLPETPEKRAWVRQICHVIASDIHPLNNLRVLQYLTNELEQNQKIKDQWYQHWITEGFNALEEMISTSPYASRFCCGDTLSMADICLVPQVYNARRYEMDMSPWPTLMNIEQEAMNLEAVIKASPEHQPDTPEDLRFKLHKAEGQ